MTKTPLHWSGNPSAEVSERVYDSASVDYDSSTLNYDGVVDADMSDTEKVPTAWEES